MSFMFNPHPFDDKTAVNRPKLDKEIISAIISGTRETAGHLNRVLSEKLKQNNGKSLVIAIDGYIGAQWKQLVNLISQELKRESMHVLHCNFSEVYKTPEELDIFLSEHLKVDKEKDPVSLFGKLFKGSYEDLMDKEKISNLYRYISDIKATHNSTVVIVYGNGCTIEKFRELYDFLVYIDITPKRVILRARNGCYANLGDRLARPIKEMLRRCYYVDFEVACRLRGELLKKNTIDFYIAGDDPDCLIMLPNKAFNNVMKSMAKYPFRCKPVYLEGVWGGHYVTKIRNITGMRNCAWVFDLIPLEVSIVIEAGRHIIDFPYFTFVQKEGEAIMGWECMEKFGGYFPIRFNYDDSWHSSGNMSIQLHSGHRYNVENYNEHGRQDESYYVVATGHEAKTYIGFNEDIDPDDFISEAKRSEKEFSPVNYQKYISHIKSRPGTQVMIPAGTIHSSGRNQVILEIGSLTIGSYTYKMYDYLRSDLDGNLRPIHSYHGEKNLRKERKSSWVRENLVQKPRLVRDGKGWAEYIVGEHDLLYFSLRRFEFEKEIEDDTNGKFHVLALVDGEKVIVQSIENPELCYEQNYLDIIVVPANVGKYVIRNLGNQPVYMHKTILKDGFVDDKGK